MIVNPIWRRIHQTSSGSFKAKSGMGGGGFIQSRKQEWVGRSVLFNEYCNQLCRGTQTQE
jgi:hypothetical protein